MTNVQIPMTNETPTSNEEGIGGAPGAGTLDFFPAPTLASDKKRIKIIAAW
jgi:hypothetical protein